MAKSFTRKKSNNQLPQEVVEHLDQFTDYVSFWTRHELHRIQQQIKTPLCLPIPNGFKIGNYTLKLHENRRCEVRNNNNEVVHMFDDKRSAVLYAIYSIQRKYKLADAILALDTEINKNTADVLAWKNNIVRAKQRNDYETVDIRIARLDIAQKDLEKAKINLSKIYLTAKYNKIWDL
jgi:hypothetical protein